MVGDELAAPAVEAYMTYMIEAKADLLLVLEDLFGSFRLSRLALLPTILLQAACCDRADIAKNAVLTLEIIDFAE